MHATSEFLPAALWSGKLFDGQWPSGASAQDVIEPATGQVLGQIAMTDPAGIAAAAATA
ncbi:MAG TPA: benzaldehyde dehydrogenase, partial [Stenotrophomonas sp.]|nr:benzaldehyde dehydrogenase [Stenotrophomonas sp.]